MPKKFHIATFGCRTNQADSAALREDFLNQRYQETEASAEADIIVVNSCTVTHRSDQQVRQLVRHLRRENAHARLYVTGCYAQRQPEDLASIPGVHGVVGNTRKSELVQITSHPVQPATRRELARIYRDDFSQVREIDLTAATQTGGRTRPFVKIQDGCDAHCTYCIIPAVRGPSRSVPPQQIIQQVRDLVGRGFKEIVLTGIHIGTYGRHLQPPFRLNQLLEELLSITELEQIRISSIEPMELSRRIIRLAVESGGRIAPHFHICLQSGCDRTLKRMLRPYTARRFASIVKQIREELPDAGIGTDVIAGFPGESERDHQESLEFVEAMPFTYLHVFPYSDRSGTRASELPDKVDPSDIRRRASQLRRLSAAKNRSFARGFLGRRVSVLSLDDEKKGARSAISNNYLKALLPREIAPNQLLVGQVRKWDGEHLHLEV